MQQRPTQEPREQPEPAKALDLSTRQREERVQAWLARPWRPRYAR